jgi:hypothetical protein
VRALVASRFVLLGEKHDNPDNHQVQAVVLRAILASGRRPDRRLRDAHARRGAGARLAIWRPRRATPAGLGPAVDWKNSGWPDWAYYQPIAQAALDAGVPIVAANLTPATARALARGQRAALPASLAERYALDRPPSADLQAALTTEIREAHCGHFPPTAWTAWCSRSARATRPWPRACWAARRRRADRRHRPRPQRPRRAGSTCAAQAPDATIATLAPLEVREEWTQPAQYAAAYGGALPSTGSGSRRGWTTTIPAPLPQCAAAPAALRRGRAWHAAPARARWRLSCGRRGSSGSRRRGRLRVVGVGEHGDAADLRRVGLLNAAFQSCSALTRSSTHASRKAGAPVRKTRPCVRPAVGTRVGYPPGPSRSTSTSPPWAADLGVRDRHIHGERTVVGPRLPLVGAVRELARAPRPSQDRILREIPARRLAPGLDAGPPGFRVQEALAALVADAIDLTSLVLARLPVGGRTRRASRG